MASLEQRKAFRALKHAEFEAKGIKSRHVPLPLNELPMVTLNVHIIQPGLYKVYKEGYKRTQLPEGPLHVSITMRGSRATIEAVKRVLGEYCIIEWMFKHN